ncbi:hypothetical protein HUS70_01765 [Pandoraea nosoerga]|uniref:Signal peptide protein n=1 Tax=Pandoraea nosoerga TaxID=2508296 RepID=A0A5E4S0G8_9BURK|nr:MULTISPECIES: hypothetical protein [Pandoraea]MBN4667703.1 hypothetical protein [Pandoraea nosoerga]MBN4677998.1 hypothetical protein [Pandoraea nosoerga]MBN4679497.1 hypothetical protein [Pandoraea nosoerga]MBN4743414.1 hypothetical protein [Pandoraea nosoerga]VVD68613.1 signal peptide protein [Pandoraea nosoerga]
MKRILVIAALGAAAALASGAASAHVDVGLYLGVPAPVVSAPPVYVAPQPVYVQPRPVYVAPRPVVYYGRDRWDDWRERRWEDRHDRGWHRGWRRDRDD